MWLEATVTLSGTPLERIRSGSSPGQQPNQCWKLVDGAIQVSKAHGGLKGEEGFALSDAFLYLMAKYLQVVQAFT